MNNNNLLEQYFENLVTSKPLTREEEISLTQQSRKGCKASREKLILSNLRFVIRIAREYQHKGLPLEDLISAGNLGLLLAAERFDETRGFKFISYAVWWIRQAIRQSLAQETRSIRLPANRLALLGKIYRVNNQSLQKEQPDTDPDLLAETLGVSPEMIQEILQQAQQVWSLDTPLDKESGNTLLEIISDEKQLQDEEMAEKSVGQQLHKVLETIDDREAEILRLYYGLDNDTPMTLEDIGKQFNLTRERIRQIKEKALQKMRHPKRRMQLEELLDTT
ncbi:MAG: RNA polymerase sigma factor RpoD/SigA [Candidatus Latescibacteria bacterium]|nr:RNA polymerase sigma factor RpoD/SigA [Candidatus Latescibacterota bacterium]